jgi:hypothetical protein
VESEALWYLADAEVANFDYYLTPSDPAHGKLTTGGNSPVVSTEQSRVGERSFRVYLNRQNSRSAYRTEAWPVNQKTSWGHGPNLQWRRTYWIGLSVYVPSDWRADSTSDEVLFQIHNWPDDWANSYTPPVAIRLKPRDASWNLRVWYKVTPEGSGGLADVTRAIDTVVSPAKRGAWTDWVIEYRPDWRLQTDGGVGVTRFWMDGRKVLDYSGPNAYNDRLGPYLMFGCYKSGWRDSSFSDPITERLYYFDEYRVSRPDKGSYAIVAPGAEQGLAKPMSPEQLKVT